MSDTLNSRRVTEAIDQIRKLAPKYIAATDKANAAVARIERFLNDECSIGMPASVLVEKSDGWRGVGSYRTSLVYERIDGKYRIGIRTLQGVVCWSSCPRHLKLKVIEFLPELLQKIDEKVETAMRGLEKNMEAWCCAMLSALDCEEGGAR